MLKKLFKFGENKEDVIEVWSLIEGLPDVEPIKESSHFLPSWWLNTPMWQNNDVKEGNITNNIHNKGTIRRCPAVPEFMSMGITVPLWCDLRVEIFEDGSWKWNTPAKEFTPPGISMLQLPMMWHFNPNFTVAPGVIWTDIHHEINQQMMFHKKGVFNLQRGTPLAQYIPIRREKFEYNVGNETPKLRANRAASYYHVRTKFGGGYPKHRKDEIKKGECPYHATSK